MMRTQKATGDAPSSTSASVARVNLLRLPLGLPLPALLAFGSVIIRL
jgi:hypothetical protein